MKKLSVRQDKAMAPSLRLDAIKCLSARRFFHGFDGTIAVGVAPSGSKTAEMRQYDGASLSAIRRT